MQIVDKVVYKNIFQELAEFLVSKSPFSVYQLIHSQFLVEMKSIDDVKDVIKQCNKKGTSALFVMEIGRIPDDYAVVKYKEFTGLSHKYKKSLSCD